MTGVRLIRFAELPTTRWANGLGATVEILRKPVVGEFAWRLSVATVESDAPFSSLPGVERALMPLEAGGLRLEIDGVVQHVDQHVAVRFTGEAAVRAIGVTAPGRDLNLMVRRGAGDPELRVEEVAGERAFDGIVAVVALTDGVTAVGSRLLMGDALVGERAELSGAGLVALARVGRDR